MKNRKVVILAGGFGTRISEETKLIPKPMVEIGGRPILWHIMKYYEHFGLNDFVILLGYKGDIVKDYFLNYLRNNSSFRIDLVNQSLTYLSKHREAWKVTLLDTGLDTMTGGRILAAKELLMENIFYLTYGDGLSDVNLQELSEFHEKSGAIVTMTAVNPKGRFGSIKVDDTGMVEDFKEKPIEDQGWINGGFFVCDPLVFHYLDNETTVFEREPMEKLCRENKLAAYKHHGFWKCMDTINDKNQLQNLWETCPLWKKW